MSSEPHDPHPDLNFYWEQEQQIIQEILAEGARAYFKDFEDKLIKMEEGIKKLILSPPK